MTKLVKAIRYLPEFVRLYRRLFRDSRVPFYLKLLPVGAFAYFFMPIDLLPDAVPPLTYADDLVFLFLALKYFVRWSPRPVVQEHVHAISEERRIARGA